MKTELERQESLVRSLNALNVYCDSDHVELHLNKDGDLVAVPMEKEHDLSDL